MDGNERNGWGWGERGLRIEVMSEMPPHAVGNADVGPTARLGWTEEGLVFLFTVHDSTPIYAENERLWEGDSVEVIVADAKSPEEQIRLAIKPGIDAKAGRWALRSQIEDLRKEKGAKSVDVSHITVGETADGYFVGGVLPLVQLLGSAELGKEFTLGLQVNNRFSLKGKAVYRWGAASKVVEHPELVERVRLAAKPSKPVTLGDNGTYVGYKGARIWITDAGKEERNRYAVRDEHGRVLAEQTGAGRTVLELPMPQEGLYGPLTVLRNGKAVGGIELAKPEYSREQVLRNAEFRFNPYVFSGSVLPSGDFVDAEAVRAAVGEYRVRTRYFDAAFQEVKRASKPGQYGAVVEIHGEHGESDVRYVTLYCSPKPLGDWRAVEMGMKEFVFPDELGIPAAVVKKHEGILSREMKYGFREIMTSSDRGAVILAGMAESQDMKEPAVMRTGPQTRNAVWWYELKNRLGEKQAYTYFVRTPAEYDRAKEKKFPVIVYLHGSGQQTEKREMVEKNNWIWKYLAEHAELPFILVTPQCPTNRWDPMLVKSVLDEVAKTYRVDADRVILTGQSMGGHGAWMTAMWYPDRFAALVPLCGIGDAADMARLKNLPTWVFHGDADDVVPFEADRVGVESLKQLGGKVQMTVYPGAGHTIAARTYVREDLYQWMLEQKRVKP